MQSTADPCLYTSSKREMFHIAVYVDDIVLACKSIERIAEVKKALAKQFEVKDLGELHYFLGMKVVQDQKSGEVWIGQPAYAKNIVQHFGMEHAKAVATPVDPSVKLEKAKEDSEIFDQGRYQLAVGSLLYLSIGTRPDITYAVSNLARYCARPTKEHWLAIKRIIRYLIGTLDCGLFYCKDGSKKCIGFSDAYSPEIRGREGFHNWGLSLNHLSNFLLYVPLHCNTSL